MSKPEEHLHHLEAKGLIKRGTGTLGPDFWTRPRPKDPEGEVMRALLDERESERDKEMFGGSHGFKRVSEVEG